MSNNTITFSAIKPTNAVNGTLEKDKDGYYKVTLGALNVANGEGSIYISDGINDLMNNNSYILARKLKSGYLKGEANHPKFEAGMSKSDYFSRNMKIDLQCTSHHIKEIMLTPTSKSIGQNGVGNIIIIEAWVKPTGPFGPALEKELDDPNINVAFSIRCFTKDTVVGGVLIKKLLQIITWDWVIEPGIKIANKWDKLSVEDSCLFTIDGSSLEELMVGVNVSGMSTEACDELSTICHELKKHSENKMDTLTNW